VLRANQAAEGSKARAEARRHIRVHGTWLQEGDDGIIGWPEAGGAAENRVSFGAVTDNVHL
jgi:hypothetical protein